jgi:hypothetical protein
VPRGAKNRKNLREASRSPPSHRGTPPASRPSVPLRRRPARPDDPNCQPLASFSSGHRGAPTRTACSSLLAHLRHSSPPPPLASPLPLTDTGRAGKLKLLSPCSVRGHGGVTFCFACSLARPVFDGITVRVRCIQRERVLGGRIS